MNLLEIAKARYSCRNFKPDLVEKDKIMTLLEAARVAPSGVNFQPWHFIVIQSSENLEKIHQAYKREWLKTAPLIIVACGDHDLSWRRNDGKDILDIDVTIAIDHLILQATELGLGTCWVCNFNVIRLKENLKLPDHIEPIAIIPIGYPNDVTDPDRHDIKRKSLNEIVHWESISIL
ncbi:MAG: nitroreductase family protein [Bacteroidetes bacterium]|nr:nitroreductase family protein [Bacteroidota bacterium]